MEEGDEQTENVGCNKGKCEVEHGEEEERREDVKRRIMEGGGRDWRLGRRRVQTRARTWLRRWKREGKIVERDARLGMKTGAKESAGWRRDVVERWEKKSRLEKQRKECLGGTEERSR